MLAGSDRPLVVASGTGLVARSKTGGPAAETDDHVTSAEFPRAATEEAVDALIAGGGRVIVEGRDGHVSRDLSNVLGLFGDRLQLTDGFTTKDPRDQRANRHDDENRAEEDRRRSRVRLHQEWC